MNKNKIIYLFISMVVIFVFMYLIK